MARDWSVDQLLLYNLLIARVVRWNMRFGREFDGWCIEEVPWPSTDGPEGRLMDSMDLGYIWERRRHLHPV